MELRFRRCVPLHTSSRVQTYAGARRARSSGPLHEIQRSQHPGTVSRHEDATGSADAEHGDTTRAMYPVSAIPRWSENCHTRLPHPSATLAG